MPVDLTGKKIVITGTFRHAKRKDLTAQLKALGAAVTGSVSSKTMALLAGSKAGSKINKAHRSGVPVFPEAYLPPLLEGKKSFEELVVLAKTFYSVEWSQDRDVDPPESLYNQFGAMPPGVDEERWPTSRGELMRHLFTLDLRSMPALQLRYPGYRTLSVFAMDGLCMYELNHRGLGARVLLSTQAQIDARPRPPEAAQSWGYRQLLVEPHTWSTSEELFDHPGFGRARVLGPPCWLQAAEDEDGFIMQGGEEFGIAGDGLLFVFEDRLRTQVS